MAWAKRAYKMVCEWEDREGTRTQTSFNLSFSGTGIRDGADALAKASALAPLVQALSSCRLLGYRVTSGYNNETAAFAGEVERRAQFSFVSADGRPYTTQVPGFKDSLLDTDGRSITVRGGSVKPEISNFTTAIVSGLAGWGNGCVTVGGLDLVAVKRAKKVHVPSLARRARRSG